MLKILIPIDCCCDMKNTCKYATFLKLIDLLHYVTQNIPEKYKLISKFIARYADARSSSSYSKS